MKIALHYCFVLLALYVATMSLAGASSPALKLVGKQQWLAIASTKDIDTAIGIARQFDYEGQTPRVVTSISGWYAVILGPYAATSLEQLKRRNTSLPPLPSDALLSHGDKYVETVWQPKPPVSVWSEYALEKPARLSVADLEVEVAMTKQGDDLLPTLAKGSEKGKPAFSFTVEAAGDYVDYSATATLARLDPQSPTPQLLFTRYTGGAHCCTQTWIATKSSGAGGWSLIEGQLLDGGGYWLEDVDGDGAQELVSVDNSFLYAFDSYAGSYAPLRFSRLVGGKLEDVTNLPALQPRLRQDLAGMQFQAKIEPSSWKSNGFLAAWVANKMRLGEGEDAWLTMLENYDKKSDFGPQKCLTGQEVEKCPAESLQTIPFPTALADFLRDKDYGPLPAEAH